MYVVYGQVKIDALLFCLQIYYLGINVWCSLKQYIISTAGGQDVLIHSEKI